MRRTYAGRRGSGRGAFIMRIDTTQTSTPSTGTASSSTQFYFPIFDGQDRDGYTVNFTIDWGDGTTSDVNPTNFATACLHTYSVGGQYDVSAEGSVCGFNFWAMSQETGKADSHKLLEIKQWGDLMLTGGAGNSGSLYTRIGQVFRQCINLTTVSASDFPIFPNDLNNNLNDYGARGLFSSCSSLVTINNIANWQCQTLIRMETMFNGCQKLQFGTNAGGGIDLTGWVAGRVTDFDRMFTNCSALGSGSGAKIFSDVGQKVTSGIITMSSMFSGCTNFNNNNAGTMNSWVMGRVTKTDFMFADCPTFNDNITSWDTGSITTMRGMFNDCTVFNQNIGSWNTGGVTDMRDMFTNCAAFDQDISGWNVNAWSQVGSGDTPISGPGTSLTLSTSNYDDLLVAWAAYSFPSWPGGTVDFGNSQYSLTSPGNVVINARNSLITTWGSINDGGGV